MEWWLAPQSVALPEINANVKLVGRDSVEPEAKTPYSEGGLDSRSSLIVRPD